MTALTDLPIYQAVQRLAVDVTWDAPGGKQGIKVYGNVRTGIGPLAVYDRVAAVVTKLAPTWKTNSPAWRVALHPGGRLVSPVVLHRPTADDAPHRLRHWPSLAAAMDAVERVAQDDGWADIVAPATRRAIEDRAKTRETGSRRLAESGTTGAAA